MMEDFMKLIESLKTSVSMFKCVRITRLADIQRYTLKV